MTVTTCSPAPVRKQEADAVPTDIPVLEMVSPMVGFPEQRHFALARLDDTGVVCDLRSLENPDLSFVVVPPHMFFSDYHPEVDDEVVRALGIESADDLVTLVVVTLGEQPGDATANLLAPVLINHHTRRAAQVLLADADLPLRAPLTA
ncbi:MAG: flagellar assembly protein FliW [Nocardioidaceae bacterium]